ncbi:MAG: hypothetical protein JJU28_17805 [Cyclobacteriaceae bacterium]|nr:hypothetical protein [Cyclobacteriaceae bacterium]
MTRTKAHESRSAIEKLYIIMRHLFIRGSYKPTGVSGESLVKELLTLKPEIYGLMDDPEKVELDGLLYIIERLPAGIEECRYIRLISREGLERSDFNVIIPPKRRRNCYRVDQDQMYVEMTRGRSDIYDILTHLTFLYIESEKIERNSLDHKGRETLDWRNLREIVEKEKRGEEFNEEAAYSYLSNILGRTFDVTRTAGRKFKKAGNLSIFSIIFHMGKLAMEEQTEGLDREIFFSASLRERIGHHVYGELWADHIKRVLLENDLLHRPLHIISANLHSVVNTIYGYLALGRNSFEELERLAVEISQENKYDLAHKIKNYALKHGLIEINDTSGTNISAQIIDLAKINSRELAPGVPMPDDDSSKLPVIFVMDYAFGEQAYECLDELLKPYELPDKIRAINVQSVSIMGKAGILNGKKGDIMIPTAHVFEGTADNYPIRNGFKTKDFEGFGPAVYEGPMVTVLGTSLQNKDVLKYFMESSWKAIGLEMEGAHYQKAIQSASKIRNSIHRNINTFYAYYASDNPLETGSTLASGGLGMDGVRPTYLITLNILKKIFLKGK